MTRVVLDTNVLIDANRGEGSYPKRILDLINKGEVQAFITNPVRREQELIFGRLVKDPQLTKEVKEYLSLAREVEPVAVSVQLDDEEDVKLLAVAVGGRVQYLITGDKHLLDIGEYEGIQVVTPEVWWQWWQKDQDDSGHTWQSWTRNILGR